MDDRFKPSKLTASLVDFLRVHDKGAEITYEEISRKVKTQIHSTHYNLMAARKKLARDHGQVWDPVRPGVGVRRLTDAEIEAKLQPKFIRSADRKLKKGEIEGDNVDLSQLNLAAQSRNSVSRVQMGAARNFLSRGTEQKLARFAAKGNANDLPQFNMLDLAMAFATRGQKKPD